MLTKAETSQDRIGSYPMFVLGSIQRNDGLLEGAGRGGSAWGSCQRQADSQKADSQIPVWETGRCYALEKSRRGHLSWPYCWAPLSGSVA